MKKNYKEESPDLTNKLAFLTPSPSLRAKIGFLSKTSSPSPNASIQKQTIKKQQSLLKAQVQSFGELLLKWKNDVYQLKALIESLQSIISTYQSIMRISTIPSYWKYQFTNDFPNLSEKILTKIQMDAEFIFLQIRSFHKNLQDLNIAFILKIDEIIKTNYGLISDYQITSEIIFTTDHVLDMISLQKKHSLELSRKENLLEQLHKVIDLFVEKPNENINLLLDRVYDDWDDNSSNSFLELDQVESFLAQNNIKKEDK